MTIDIVSQASTTNTALPYAKRDLIFDGTSGGVWGFDLASRLSYSRQAAPVDGSAITDLEIAVYGAGNGDVALPSGRGAIGWGGSKFDFSTVTEGGCSLRGPASVMSAIRGNNGTGATATCTISGGVVNAVTITNGGSGYIQGQAQVAFYGAGQTYPITVTPTVTGGQITAIPLPSASGWTAAPTVVILPSPQYFLWCAYMVLPAAADWNTSSQNAGRMPMFCVADTTQADNLLIVYQTNTGKLRFSRDLVSTSVSRIIDLTPAADQFGALCQVAYWRNGTEVGARIKRVAAGAADNVATQPTYEPAVDNFAARRPRWGIDGAYGYTGAAWNTARAASAKWKLARGWIEALNVTGRNVADVLDRDYALTLARGVY